MKIEIIIKSHNLWRPLDISITPFCLFVHVDYIIHVCYNHELAL